MILNFIHLVFDACWIHVYSEEDYRIVCRLLRSRKIGNKQEWEVEENKEEGEKGKSGKIEEEEKKKK